MTQTRTAVRTATATATATAEMTAENVNEAEMTNEATLTGTGFKLPDGKKSVDDLTPAERKGAVAWKQGYGWWIIYPPYKKQNSFFSIRAPKGINTTKNARTAFDTIQKTSGDVPNTLSFDRLGIVKATITRPPASPRMRNRAAINFTRTTKAVSRHNVRNKRVGQYFVSGNMVSRHRIGR
jgi:hypothetical protein